jgi:hypothetical protein
MANVFVVEIDVNEVAQAVLVVVEMLAQFGVRRRQIFQCLARRRRFDLHLRLAACILPERRRDNDCDCHA